MIHRILILIILVSTSSSFTWAQSIEKKKVKAGVKHPGISRVRAYDISHPDLPPDFKGFRIVFLSDLHYKSKFKEKQLTSLMRLVRNLQPDLLLMGGDYKGQCIHMKQLFDSIAALSPPYGIAGVWGNHDYGICEDTIQNLAKERGIHLLAHELLSIRKDSSEIFVAGVRNPFDLATNGTSPAQQLDSAAYVILLTHTPDYVEDVNNSRVDLALAGHTHGGQITFFGWFAPKVNSHYGQRFRTGLKRTSQNIPVIITNGLGTSRRNIRLFAPSEVVVLDLH